MNFYYKIQKLFYFKMQQKCITEYDNYYKIQKFYYKMRQIWENATKYLGILHQTGSNFSEAVSLATQLARNISNAFSSANIWSFWQRVFGKYQFSPNLICEKNCFFLVSLYSISVTSLVYFLLQLLYIVLVLLSSFS